MSNLWFIKLKEIIKDEETYEKVCEIVNEELEGKKATPREIPMPDSIAAMVEAGVQVAKNPPPVAKIEWEEDK